MRYRPDPSPPRTYQESKKREAEAKARANAMVEAEITARMPYNYLERALLCVRQAKAITIPWALKMGVPMDQVSSALDNLEKQLIVTIELYDGDNQHDSLQDRA